MFDTIAPRYELVNDVMTFGLDRRWRRRTIAGLELAPGSLVLDLACGTGDLLRGLERAEMRAVGVDLSAGMLAGVRNTAAPLVHGDGAALPFPDQRFDGCVSGFALRNFADLPAVLAEAARVLRPGGRLALLEVDRPDQPLLARANRAWCELAVPRIGALLSDPAAYRYLTASYAYLPPRRELLALLAAAGFEAVEHRPLSGGITQLVTATRAGAPRLRPAPARSGRSAAGTGPGEDAPTTVGGGR